MSWYGSFSSVVESINFAVHKANGIEVLVSLPNVASEQDGRVPPDNGTGYSVAKLSATKPDYARVFSVVANHIKYPWFQLERRMPPRLMLPPLDVTSEDFSKSFWHGVTLASNAVDSLLTTKTTPWTENCDFSLNPFRFYETMSASRAAGKPIATKLTETWKHDVEFGWQRMNGLNPTVIKKVSGLPAGFAFSDQQLQKIDGFKDATLEKLAADGKLFLCDYGLLSSAYAIVQRDDPKRCPLVPRVLLALRARIASDPLPHGGSKHEEPLVPIAIELRELEPAPAASGTAPVETAGDGTTSQSAEKSDEWVKPTLVEVFTAGDDKKNLWLAAKTHAQCADFNYHEVWAHLGKAHLVLEAVFTAMYQNLAPQHPLRRLMEPHAFFLLPLNFLARLTLIRKDTGVIPTHFTLTTPAIDELLGAGFDSFDFTDLHPEWNAAARGIDKCKLPGSRLPHDGLKTWEMIKSFVLRIVERYYTSWPKPANEGETATPGHNDSSYDEHCCVGDSELVSWVLALAAPHSKEVTTVEKVLGDAQAVVTDLSKATAAGFAEVASRVMKADTTANILRHVSRGALDEGTGCGFKGLFRFNGATASKYNLTSSNKVIFENIQWPQKEEIVTFLSILIYHGSVYHSAVNNGQYDYASFVPNMPTRFQLPLSFMMKAKADASIKDIALSTIARALPEPTSAAQALAVTDTLTAFTDDRLGSYPGTFFEGDAVVREAVETFQSNLVAVSDRISVTNEAGGLYRPYTYADPAQMAQGVSI